MIADANLVVGQAVNGKILAELPVGEIVSTELASPVVIGVDLIDEDGSVLASVSGEVSLPVAVDVETTRHASPLNGPLPNGGVNSPSAPVDIARQTDVHL
ncbi:hypothetical protein MPC1_260012 [Methylocella tundrae]|nr:hypothetical protein MPC1_260012 [Methylocella tundrae]